MTQAACVLYPQRQDRDSEENLCAIVFLNGTCFTAYEISVFLISAKTGLLSSPTTLTVVKST